VFLVCRFLPASFDWLGTSIWSQGIANVMRKAVFRPSISSMMGPARLLEYRGTTQDLDRFSAGLRDDARYLAGMTVLVKSLRKDAIIRAGVSCSSNRSVATLRMHSS